MVDKNKDAETNVHYSNSLHLEVSLYDFKFIFGQTKKGEHVDIVNVYMSPEHAKVMKLVLDKNIELYESKFSAIELPEEVVTTIKERKPTEITPEDK